MHIIYKPAMPKLEKYPRKTMALYTRRIYTRMYSLTWQGHHQKLTLKCLTKNYTTHSLSKIKVYG